MEASDIRPQQAAAPRVEIYPRSRTSAVDRATGDALGITVTSFDDVRELWSRLETQGVLTAYQRFGWSECYARQVERPAGAKICVVSVQDEHALPVLLMPLAIERLGFCTIARMPGGKHANFHMPVFRAPPPLWQDEDVERLLARVSTALGGVDLFAFQNQPLAWAGHANPFALRGNPAASNAYKLGLSPDPDATIARVLSKDSRRKLRQKRRRLEDIGPTRHVLASTPAERRLILDAFFSQKLARMREIGVPDPFGDDAIRAFVEEATGVDGGAAVIDLHALMVGEQVAATFAGAPSRGRLSGMFNSFNAAPEIARNSPGDLLLVDVIGHYAAAGFQAFDLGVGEARYKDMFCDTCEPLVDSLFPISAIGRIGAGILGVQQNAKAALKRSPRLMQLIRRGRSLLG